MKGATSWAETANPSRASEFTPVFSGVCFRFISAASGCYLNFYYGSVFIVVKKHILLKSLKIPKGYSESLDRRT
jgi:hypothetical protein